MDRREFLTSAAKGLAVVPLVGMFRWLPEECCSVQQPHRGILPPGDGAYHWVSTSGGPTKAWHLNAATVWNTPLSDRDAEIAAYSFAGSWKQR